MKKNFIFTIFFSIIFILFSQQLQAQANIGNVAPDFTLKALNGKEVNLSKLKGKYVLIDFWGSWCQPCRKMNPLMVELYANLKEKKVKIEFISVACNERNEEAWKNAITKDKLTWTQLNDAHANPKSIAMQYAITGFPTCILVSTDGKILYREHPATLIPKVEQMFGIQAQANIGNVAPDFTIKALDGKQITLSKLKGKYVLINFWGSWWRPGRGINPLMVELYAKLKEEKKANIEFISVALNEENEEAWKKAIIADNLNWIQLNDAHASPKSIARQYAITEIPICILISPDGKILHRENPLTLIKKMEQMFEIQVQANVGNVAPDFTLKALDGKEVTLSKLKGKYVLIDFWGSWCRPCRGMNPLMVKLYAKLKEKKANIEFISVACDERNEEAWKNAIINDKLTWTQLNDAHAYPKSIAMKYAITSYPTCILVSTDGKILYREHPSTLITKVKQLFEISE